MEFDRTNRQGGAGDVHARFGYVVFLDARNLFDRIESMGGESNHPTAYALDSILVERTVIHSEVYILKCSKP
jgi:hypothetical protein